MTKLNDATGPLRIRLVGKSVHREMEDDKDAEKHGSAVWIWRNRAQTEEIIR
jgi:hypothetical protein